MGEKVEFLTTKPLRTLEVTDKAKLLHNEDLPYALWIPLSAMDLRSANRKDNWTGPFRLAKWFVEKRHLEFLLK